MNPLSIVLKKLRESKKLTIEELAKKAGIGKGTVGDIETGKSKSTVKTLDKIAEALELSTIERVKLFDAFLGGNIKKSIRDCLLHQDSEYFLDPYSGEKLHRIKDKEKIEMLKNFSKNREDIDILIKKHIEPIELMTIPVYSSVAAGCGYIPDAEPIDHITIQKLSGECIAVKVDGDSMEPTFFNGDLVVLKKEIEVGIGEIGVFINKFTGESLVKRLKKKNGVYVLESDNHIFPDKEIKTDEIVCCGKVVNVIKKDLKKRISPLQELLDDIPPNKIKLAEKLLKTLISDDEE